MRKNLALLLTLALLAGCAPANPAPGPSEPDILPPAQEPIVHVHTDYSALEEKQARQPDIGGRWYEDTQTQLIPRDDYGTLVPFIGARTYFPDFWGGEFIMSAYLYGLMTEDGRVVLDPVCTSISRLSWTDEDRNSRALPVWQLEKGSIQENRPQEQYAFAAEDGSWVTDFVYLGWTDMDGQILAGTDDSLHLLDPETGEVLRTWELADLGLTGEDIQWSSWGDVYEAVQMSPMGLLIGFDHSQADDMARLLDLEAGKVNEIAGQEWVAYMDTRFGVDRPWWSVRVQNGTAVVTYGDETYTFPVEDLPMECYGSVVRDRIVVFDSFGEDQWCAVYTLDGECVIPAARGQASEIIEWTDEELPVYIAITTADGSSTTVWNEQGQPVFTVPASRPWATRYGGLAQITYDNSVGIYELATGKCVFYRNFGLGD